MAALCCRQLQDRQKVHTSARPDPPSQVLNNRHDVIMHYVNVITNSGNLKQPGRDTILIDYSTTTTTTTAITTTILLLRV